MFVDRYELRLEQPVLEKYAHIGLKQNLLRSITLDIITKLLENAAFVCTHVVGRFCSIVNQTAILFWDTRQMSISLWL